MTVLAAAPVNHANLGRTQRLRGYKLNLYIFSKEIKVRDSCRFPIVSTTTMANWLRYGWRLQLLQFGHRPEPFSHGLRLHRWSLDYRSRRFGVRGGVVISARRGIEMLNSTFDGGLANSWIVINTIEVRGVDWEETGFTRKNFELQSRRPDCYRLCSFHAFAAIDYLKEQPVPVLMATCRMSISRTTYGP